VKPYYRFTAMLAKLDSEQQELSSDIGSSPGLPTQD